MLCFYVEMHNLEDKNEKGNSNQGQNFHFEQSLKNFLAPRGPLLIFQGFSPKTIKKLPNGKFKKF